MKHAKEQEQEINLSSRLKRVLQRIISNEEPLSLLETATFEIAKALSSRLVMLFLTDNEQGEYQLASCTQLSNFSPIPNNLRLRFGDGIIGQVGDRAEVIKIDQLDEDQPLSDLDTLQPHHFGAFLGLPLIEQGQLVGILTLQRSTEEPFDENEQAELVTFATQLADIIYNIQDKIALHGINHKGKKKVKDTMFEGIAGAPGITLGKAITVYASADLSTIPDKKSNDPEEEWQLMRQAIADARKEFKLIHKQAQETLPPAEQALFEVYIQMLESRSLTNEIKNEIIQQEQWAQGALRRVIERHLRHMEQFEDEYLRERADDLRDLGNRILSKLQQKNPQQQKRPKQYILISAEITASILLEAKPKAIIGIISGRGSSNSHVAILARALGIPAVMGVHDIPLSQLDGKTLAIDGYSGHVYLYPSKETKQEFRDLAEEEQAFDLELQKIKDQAAVTLDKHRIQMLVNTGLASDIQASADVGAEGSGLFRTEIPFMMRERFPSEEEQREIYQQTLSAFSPNTVVMRTLDIGGDKSLPYFQIEEDNPFLGWRGVRITLDHPEIFVQQIRAMLKASIGLNNLSIMIPMVTSISEAESCIELIQQAHEELCEQTSKPHPIFPKLGLMIEVPAAVYLTYELASRVDFISVGSNDLIQYLLAVDRNNPRVANLYDGLHPAVLRALKFTIDASHRAKRPAGVCGELAADPLAAVLLLGMGYDSLSMNAKSLPRIKWIIRHITYKKAKQLTKEVLAIDDPAEIRCHMEMALDELGLGGLIRAGRE